MNDLKQNINDIKDQASDRTHLLNTLTPRDNFQIHDDNIKLI